MFSAEAKLIVNFLYSILLQTMYIQWLFLILREKHRQVAETFAILKYVLYLYHIHIHGKYIQRLYYTDTKNGETSLSRTPTNYSYMYIS